MGLETSTYIAGLTATWPVSSDPKSQGDDHLRLLKGVLQSTFPNASAPYYFPQAQLNLSGTIAATAQNSVVYYDTTAGNVAITLPVAPAAGWYIDLLKYSTDTNAITVSPPSGNIYSQFGPVATVRVGAVNSLTRLVWNGSAWFCLKVGPMIGSTVSFDGTGVPAGYLALDGSTYSSATFAELFSALGTTTLRDKRGRVEIGSGTGAGLTNRVNGTAYGAETMALATANLPPYTPSGSTPHTLTASVPWSTSSNQVGTQAGFTDVVAGGSTAITISGGVTFSGNAQGGTSTAFGLLQPSIGTQKLIRAC